MSTDFPEVAIRVGCHVSIGGNIYESVDRAAALGCETMQIFSRNPRGWQVKLLSEADAEEFKRRRKAKGISPLVVHIPYLINLASPEEKLYKRSIAAYIEDVERADTLGAEYFNTHVGNHKGMGEDFGLDRLGEALDTIIERSKPKVMILLENTAGSGTELGYTFEHFQGVIKRVKRKDMVGLCLDTCHAYAAGYDVATKKGLEATLGEIDSSIGLKKLKVIHANDSKAPLGSHIDRHEHIGQGRIGTEGFRVLTHHPVLRELPFILETPKKSPTDDPMNLAKLRQIYKGR